MQEDVWQAYEMYGSPPDFVRGKMTKKRVNRAIVDESLVLDEKKQVLYSDVMHINSNKFLITVCKLLQLVMQCRIERESQSKLGFALQEQLNLLHSRSFLPTLVHTDPQSAFRALRGFFPEVVIDVGGASDYVAKVAAKICRIKEIYRSVKAGLKWKLPPTRVKGLVAYAVSWINILRTTAINLSICPCVLFTGMRINYKKELELAFGNYIEVYNGMDNTSKSRSIPEVIAAVMGAIGPVVGVQWMTINGRAGGEETLDETKVFLWKLVVLDGATEWHRMSTTTLW
jgi:hypothetical protein